MASPMEVFKNSPVLGPIGTVASAAVSGVKAIQNQVNKNQAIRDFTNAQQKAKMDSQRAAFTPKKQMQVPEIINI